MSAARYRRRQRSASRSRHSRPSIRFENRLKPSHIFDLVRTSKRERERESARLSFVRDGRDTARARARAAP